MNKKVLVVSYLPSGEYSNTKKLLDYFLTNVKNAEIEHLDLIETPPEFFGYEAMSAYYSRNYNGKKLTDSQQKAIAPMDKMCEQMLKADIVVLAHPMHNFGIPGIVKTWFDSVLQKGKAFDYGDKGPFGMLTDKKALSLYTSGGSYTDDKVTTDYPNWNTLKFLTKINFGFAGFNEVEVIGASTANPEKLEANLSEAKNEIDRVIAKWFHN